MNEHRDNDPANAPSSGKTSNEAPEADKVAADDRHKTEKLTRHDGVDPNAGQE